MGQIASAMPEKNNANFFQLNNQEENPRKTEPSTLLEPAQYKQVAVVDDDEGIHLYINDHLSKMGFSVTCFQTVEQFNDYLRTSNADVPRPIPFDIVLCDIRLPGEDGLSFVKSFKTRFTDVPVVLMTAFANVSNAVAAIKDGAFDYIEKPFNIERLNTVLMNAVRLRDLNIENQYLKTQLSTNAIQVQGVMCSSPAMQAVYDLIKRVSPTESSVLIAGESGVGKELVARSIHDNSKRASCPFVSINCSAIPESLLESELFGHSKGSFTGATQHRKGLFEEADGGTLFLDEIGDLDIALQVKLLRVLQDHKIRAVGDNMYRTVDVRIVAATHKNLVDEIKVGKFREDLYYRLNVIPIHIPPLRQRHEDIVVLARHFLNKFSEKNGKMINGFTPAAIEKLMGLSWKGNVRELQNVIERSVVLAADSMIGENDIPVALDVEDEGQLLDHVSRGMPTLKDFEHRYIRSVLKKYNGEKENAAKILGLSRRTLYRKLSQVRASELRASRAQASEMFSGLTQLNS